MAAPQVAARLLGPCVGTLRAVRCTGTSAGGVVVMGAADGLPSSGLRLLLLRQKGGMAARGGSLA